MTPLDLPYSITSKHIFKHDEYAQSFRLMEGWITVILNIVFVIQCSLYFGGNHNHACHASNSNINKSRFILVH